MRQNFTVGITGGIGSGKTAASDYFAAVGIVVVDADVVSRECVALGEPALATILQRFGDEVLLPDGNLNRTAMRERVFKDANERLWLEALLHPLIGERIQAQISTATSGYTMLVSPLLLETEQRQAVDRILLIDVTEQVQLERTIARDGNTVDQVKRIMAAQMSRNERRKLADDVVGNDGDIKTLHAKLEHLHNKYLALSDRT